MRYLAILLCLITSSLIFNARAAQAVTQEELLRIVEQQSKQIDQLNRRITALEQAVRRAAPPAVTQSPRRVQISPAPQPGGTPTATAATPQPQLQVQQTGATGAAETAGAARVEQEKGEPSVTFTFGPAPTLKGKDAQGRDWEFKVRGRLFVDGGFLGDSDGLYTGDNATELRDARLGVEGKFLDGFFFKFETDFAGDNVNVKDAFLQYDGPLVDPLFIKAGQFKTPNSLEELTSSRFTTFMERAAITDAFGLNRRIGIGTGATGEHWGLEAGLFGQNVNVAAPAEGMAVAGRGWYHTTFDQESETPDLIHLGLSSRYRGFSNDDNQNHVVYEQKPFFHFASRDSVSTGQIDNARSDVFLGGELAWVQGPWSFQGEVANTFLQKTEGKGANNLWGGYGSLSYFVTDDTRHYVAKEGAFGRVKVKNPLEDGGWGAWQLGGRFDYIDLNSGSVGGGQQYSAIAGVNWYLNDYARIMLDGAVTQVFNAEGDAAATGSSNTIYGLGARVQVDW